MRLRNHIIAFIFVLLCFVPCAGAGHGFVHLSFPDVPGSKRVYSIRQDGDGYMWFYTQGGIDRYDGNRVRHYQIPDSVLTSSFIPSSSILKTGRDGRVRLIMTNGYVLCYDLRTDSFFTEFDFSRLLDEECLFDVALDDSGAIWAGTDGGVVIIRDGLKAGTMLQGSMITVVMKTAQFVLLGTADGAYIHDEGNGLRRITGTEGVRITSAYYSEGRLFIGTYSNGVYIADLASCSAVRSGAAIPRNPIRSIVGTADGGVMVGMDGAGIIVLDRSGEKIIGSYQMGPDLGNLCDNTISDLCIDRDSRVWASTSTNGICCLDVSGPEISYFRNIPGNPKSLSTRHVNDVMSDREESLWFATNTGIDLCDGTDWSHFHSPEKGAVLALSQSEDGRVWGGGYGIHAFEVTRGGRVIPFDGDSFMHVFSVASSRGKVWFGCLESDLQCYDIESGTFTSYPFENVWAIAPLPDGRLILTQSRGFVIFDAATGSGTVIESLEDGTSIGPVWDVAVAGKTAFLATDTNGVLEYDTVSGRLREIGSFPHDESIVSIETDGKGIVWAATRSRLFCYGRGWMSPVEMISDDDMAFNNSASCSLRDGTVVFGTSSGAALVDPSGIFMEGTDSVRLTITDFDLIGKSVPGLFDGTSPDFAGSLTLPHNANSFAVGFSAMDFSSFRHLRYDYKLNGYDRTWHTSSGAASAQYSELAPGRYCFEVIAYDILTGKQAASRALSVRIKVSPWLTWWAITLYILAGAYIFITTFRRIRKAREERHTRERISTFVTVAHDLKTPVMLIKTPLTEVEHDETLSEEAKGAISLATRNADRLLSMVNSLLDLRNVGLESNSLNLEMIDVQEFLNEMMPEFAEAARQKGVALSWNVSDGVGEVPADRKKLVLVLDNLLSNAIKYTQAGRIDLEVRRQRSRWTLKVADTGIGIPDGQIPKVFSGGFRAENAVAADKSGYGVGLMITRQIVQKLGGTIAVDSKEGKGSAFTVSLPVKFKNQDVKAAATLPQPADAQTPAERESDCTILIVEDDTDTREYLSSALSPEYEVVAAEDGKKALEILSDRNISLVLTDAVMPVINGFELCATIKGDIATSHIPVILLTALDTKQNVISGLEAGADDYVLKPFDMSILKARIQNILSERRRLREALLSGEARKERIEYSNRLDQEFMDKVIAVAEEQLSNEEFQIADFCRELGMSRTAFYNKIKSLAGQSPNDFMRIYRLNKAKSFLEEGKYTVAEVSDMVGFSDSKYFSVSFKKQFGVSPSRVL